MAGSIIVEAKPLKTPNNVASVVSANTNSTLHLVDVPPPTVAAIWPPISRIVTPSATMRAVAGGRKRHHNAKPYNSCEF